MVVEVKVSTPYIPAAEPLYHWRQRWPHHLTPDGVAALARMIPQAGGERELIAVHTPFTGEQIGTVPACNAADVNEALARARRAQKTWAQTPLAERRAILLRYHDLLLRRKDELIDVIQMESGKARRHALEEVFDVVVNCRHYAYHGDRYLRTRPRRGALPIITWTWEHRHPVGVVGMIAPWNYPFTIPISDALPALMAGNAVILKPAEETPFMALLGAKLLREVGLPDDVFQVVTGHGREIGPPLIAGVNFVGFTGSTATGWIVAKQAAEHMIRCSLELGGKNPMIVLDDANINSAVEGAIRGCFSNAGQLCVSFERVYVQSGIYDRFVSALVKRTRSLRLDAGLDYQVEMGSLVSADQLAKVKEHVEDALARGATLLAGGRARPDIGPYFYEPTLLADVTPDMLTVREETFGPVAAIYRFDRVDEAIQAANDSPYGLNAGIWTRNERFGRMLARRIQAGTVNVNEAYAAAWASADAPMGGMKESGLGRRHGAEGILKYTESQTVSAQRIIPLAPFPGLNVHAYAWATTLALRVLRRLPFLR